MVPLKPHAKIVITAIYRERVLELQGVVARHCRNAKVSPAYDAEPFREGDVGYLPSRGWKPLLPPDAEFRRNILGECILVDDVQSQTGKPHPRIVGDRWIEETRIT